MVKKTFVAAETVTDRKTTAYPERRINPIWLHLALLDGFSAASALSS